MNMEQLFNYITSPDTMISFIVFVFGLGAIYTSVTWKLKELEKRVEKIEDLDLDSRLTKMQTDIDRIRTTLDAFNAK